MQSKYENAKNVVYKIINNITNDLYIGSALMFRRRVNKHLTEIRTQTHCNLILTRAFKKYGETNFAFYILEKNIPKEKIIEREQYYINTLNPKYNILKKAGSPIGRIVSESTRKKIGDAHRGKIVSKETRKKISESVKGFRHTSETKKRIGNGSRGNKHGIGNKNRRKVTPETILIVDRLKKNGLGCRKISKIVRLNKTTILNIFNKKYNYGGD